MLQDIKEEAIHHLFVGLIAVTSMDKEADAHDVISKLFLVCHAMSRGSGRNGKAVVRHELETQQLLNRLLGVTNANGNLTLLWLTNRHVVNLHHQ